MVSTCMNLTMSALVGGESIFIVCVVCVWCVGVIVFGFIRSGSELFAMGAVRSTIVMFGFAGGEDGHSLDS